MKNSKILITGGAGFIGSQLGLHLHRQGAEVLLLDNMSYGHHDNLLSEGKTFGRFIEKDIRASDLGHALMGVDTIFHFAGISSLPECQSSPHEALDVNTAGTGQVLEQARLAGVRRVIFSSTSAVYEHSTNPTQIENEAVTPDLTYSMSKLAAEHLCASYSTQYGMDIIVCRFFNVYGPHQDFMRAAPPLTSYLARELAQDRAPVLYNESSVKRDYVYSEDVCRLLTLMMNSNKRYSADIFNVGSGLAYSVPELYGKMLQISGKNIQPEYKNPAEIWDKYPSLFQGQSPLSRERVTKEVFKSTHADISKVKKEFQWLPQVSLDQGLAVVYNFALKHKEV